jgi:HK97 family phage portal protein
MLPGLDGWPEGYEYTAGGKSVRFIEDAVPGVRPILHTRLFHPANDHYGMSPIEAAAVAIDIHNTASAWNKALLDNSARPSGALVYSASNGQMTQDQFARLKSELETSFQGAAHAGRPLLLEGGLDWKPLSMTPKDMDFIEAKNSAAREIALAIGVPPMLLGIPGDATYSNYAEAQRAFWRSTVLPVVNRMAKGFSNWLSPAFNAELELRPDLDQVEALAPEREALWTRLEAASFLTDDEKRAAAGYAAKDSAITTVAKFNPYHDDAGRFTTADGAITGPGHGLGGAGKPGASNNDGRVRVAQAESENLRARIGGNGPPLESGTFLGKVGAGLGRYVFGPLGALISMTLPLGNGEVVAPYSGKKTTGILESAEGDYYLQSGRKGPASNMGGKGSGFDNYTKTHVEGHAAALMRQLGLTEARVYLNNPVICESCLKLLPRMLPPGAKREVVTPLGSRTFAGRILP